MWWFIGYGLGFLAMLAVIYIMNQRGDSTDAGRLCNYCPLPIALLLSVVWPVTVVGATVAFGVEGLEDFWSKKTFFKPSEKKQKCKRVR